MWQGESSGAESIFSTIYTPEISVSNSLPLQVKPFAENPLTIAIADAFGLYFPLSSHLKGEEKGEGDNRAGRSWAIGL